MILVTGVAGFIGSNVARALMARGEAVLGIDNLNDYYDVTLKHARLSRLEGNAFTFRKCDVSDRETVLGLAQEFPTITGIVHLAAQAGVRYSLINPYSYIQTNVMGQVVMQELAKSLSHLKHFVYASSSSVYGGNDKMPFSVSDPVEKPNSLYAATKRADELIGYTYAHLFGIPATGLRFFTVYGPWGRPDMAAFIFARSIVAGEPIRVFNYGEMKRDFTYIDDIVSGILAVLEHPPTGVPPHAVYNLGNNRSENLMDFIGLIETSLGRKAEMILEPLQKGDVPATYADIEASRRDFGYEPATPISVGIPKFIAWFKDYYKIAD
jgi:UDP-glucuronate 4-epimerase